MSKATFKQVWRYRFDNFMARGGSSIFIGLTVGFIGLLVVLGALRGVVSLIPGIETDPVTGADGEGGGFLRHLYVVYLELSDPGTMAYDMNSSPGYKVTAILAGIAGIVVLSALIAFITTALDQKLSDLKKGHSKVIEDDHTLILGWNDRVVEILRELVIANESEDDPCVVILSDRDKEFMDDHLKVHMPNTENTRVVTRSGAVSSLINLDVASIQTCKCVIVLATCEDAVADDEAKAASDTRVIKTILGAMASKAEGQQLNIVAELFNERNRAIANEISPEEVLTVDAQEILAKILVQTSRSVGLSVVYGEVLSFDGCEMYFYDADWGDITYGQAQFHFPDGVPLGVRKEGGSLTINPPTDTKMEDGDDVLILAEDDSTIEFRPQPVAKPTPHNLRGGRIDLSIERELIVGWNAKVPIIIGEYNDYVLDGSEIDIMVKHCDDDIREQFAQLQEELPKLKLRLIEADPLKSQSLVEVEPFRYDNIIILSQGGANADPETTDSETIVILLLLRQIFEQHADKEFTTKLITEVMDSDNQALVARTGVHDFIISNRFVSMILAQISEEPDMGRVYADLFSEDGSEIYLKPASLYFDHFPIDATFADMMAIAQQRGETCIGVKIKDKERDMDANFGVKLIPEKNTKYKLVADDALVVVAEDET